MNTIQGETGQGETETGARGDRILIIMNPASGRKKSGEPASRLREEVAGDDRIELREVDGRGLADAVRQGISQAYGTIAAAGGDGTICAVAAALAGSGCRMGVIPLGTFNYFARSLEIPEDIGEAVNLLREGRARPLDIAEVNGETFLNNASIGVYARILESRERIYARWGRSRLAAYWSVLVALARFRSRLRVRLTVDGEVHWLKTPMIFVANNPHQLELFDLEGVELLQDGKLVALIAPDTGRLGLIGFAARLGLRGARAGRDFHMLAGRDILVETRRHRTTVARDGERQKMNAPFRFRRHQGALEMILPPM